jgi:uncharacterized membrane protein (Fun14 family)
MVTPEGPDNESLRLELQEAIVTYRHWLSQLNQITGFIGTGAVVLISYGFAQKLAAILLLASGAPMLLLLMYLQVGSITSPLVNLILRIERELLVRKDSLGATYARLSHPSMVLPLGSRIEDLTDEEVRHLSPRGYPLWGPIPVILYAGTVAGVGLFVLSLTVFHYRFM